MRDGFEARPAAAFYCAPRGEWIVVETRDKVQRVVADRLTRPEAEAEAAARTTPPRSPWASPASPDATCYYVSAIDGSRRAVAAGPYETHAEALADVDRVRSIFEADDPRAHFYAWGTAGFRGPRDEAPVGVLNKAGRA